MKYNKRVTVLIIIITFLISTTSAVLGATITVPSNVSEPYDWQSGMYCAEPGDGLGLIDENGNLSTTTTYAINEFNNVTLEPSFGFANYVTKDLGYNDQDMQKVVWSSRQWGNESNVLDKIGHDSNATASSSVPIQTRSYQYGTTYYGLIKEAIEEGKSVLKSTKINNDVKVLVDQIKGTYTVGPYKLTINVNDNGYTKRAAQLLYNEIVGNGNAGATDSTKFAKFTGITGINGTDIKFVDEKGKEIAFPDFVPGEEKEFYIKFKPNNNGAIPETGNPVINISYISGFKAATLLKYVPVSVQFGTGEEDSQNARNSASQLLGSSVTEKEEGKLKVDFSRGTTVECNFIETNIIRDGSSTNEGGWKGYLKVRGTFIIKVKSEIAYYENNKAQFYQLYKVYIDQDKEAIDIKNDKNLEEEESKVKSKYNEKYKNKPYAGSYTGEENDSSCKVQPSTSTIIADGEYGSAWVGAISNQLKIQRQDLEVYNENGNIMNETEYSEPKESENDELSSISVKLSSNNTAIENELGASSNGLKSADWVTKEPRYVIHMLNKFKKYGSDTPYGCMVDADLCRITIFHKEGNEWKFVYGWNTFQGVNKKWTDAATGGTWYQSKEEWHGPRSRSFKGAWKVLNPKYIDAYGANSGMYPICYVNGGHDTECASGHCNCQTIEYAEHRNPDDYDLSHRYILQGCTGVSQEQAKWVFYNIPVSSTIVVFDKYNPMPKWFEGDDAQSVDHQLSQDVETEKITGGQAIAEAAIALACRAEPEEQLHVEWPWSRIYDDRTKAYVDAREKLIEGKNLDGGEYASCDMGVATAVRYSGVDLNMEYRTIPRIWPYLRESSNWNNVGTVNWDNYSNLQPGDVLISSNHILIYVGNEMIKKKYPNSRADVYEAGYSTYRYTSYYPSLRLLSWRRGQNEFTIFRHVNANKKMYESKEGFAYGNTGTGNGTGLTSTYVVDNPGAISSIQNVIQVTNGTTSTTGGDSTEKVKENWNTMAVQLEGCPINMQIGGRVWLEQIIGKDGRPSGKLDDGDQNFGGIQVSLYELDNEKDTTPTLVATTITDENGKYRFYGQKEKGISLINGLRKYCVMFTYNGQYYQSTYYKNDLTGGYSNAREIDREGFNKKFESIYSGNENYVTDNWHKSYSISQKIENDNGGYIEYQYDKEKTGALTFEDVYYEFLKESRLNDAGEVSLDDYKTIWDRNKKYDEVLDGTLKEWLKSKGITKEYEGIKQYIKDTLISATTYDGGNLLGIYPVYNEYVASNIDKNSEEYKLKTTRKVTLDKTYTNLYSINSDQSRNIDYGLYNRPMNDLALQKDVYQVSIIVNGKKQDYKYNKKDVNNEGTWEVKTRAGDYLYNGREAYEREVRKSEYLYDGSDAGTTDQKNMQAFVTYRIAVKNQGDVKARVNEIADYYDTDMYEFDGTLQEDTYNIKEYNYNPTEKKKEGQDGSTYVNSYVGSNNEGAKLSDITVKTKGIPNNGRGQKEIKGENYNYSTLYLTGIKSAKGEELLNPGDIAYAYVTFKVKQDETTGKVKLDQDIKDGSLKLGKRNIAEINGYSTYYTNGFKIANNLEGNEDKEINVADKVAGIVDKDSTPGSLSERDLNSNGDIITNSDDSTIDRQEDDTDKSPNIRIIINKNDNDIRKIQGYVYEDERNVSSDEAVIGNGKFDEGESKINGVTLQLVELVQDVDENGIFKGNYLGEKVWGSYTYNGISKESLENAEKDYSRYYSGKGNSNIILNGPTGTILHVENDTELGDGAYQYKSVPSGDFFIRFVYGDTAQTTLTNNTENEVNKLLNNEGIDGQKGLNAKSYNGQDYKSTVYQLGIAQDTSYNGINGFVDYENQNYYKVDDLGVNTENDFIYGEPSPDKNKMYYYDIQKASEAKDISDAKDVYEYRQLSNNWSKGENGQTLLNNRAEVLASFEKVATYKPENESGEIDKASQRNNQETMIKELMRNTKMVAQTGIINTEVEYNRKQTEDEDKLSYIIDDVDLGLTERPKAGLKINKEVTNFKLEGSNRKVIFDANKTVQNLYYSKHKEHEVNYNNIGKIKETILNKDNAKETAEIIQGYVDDEILQDATVSIQYKIKVDNIGEVDYKDEQFYYTGKTKDKSENNISKTKAVQVIDYVSNAIKFNKNEQENTWNTYSVEDMINSKVSEDIEKDYINREYLDELSTYNVIITTNDLSEGLTPKASKEGNTSKEAKLILTTAVGGESEEENVVYNNLTEIIETSNEQGRRNAYTISGNHVISDQRLGNNAGTNTLSRIDRVDPNEIDADSSQKVVLMPPTGEKDNYYTIIIGGVVSIVIIGLIALILKKKLKK